jgi:hypothetical protein
MGLTLPTLRRSQVLTNLRMLMVTVILNFKNLERTQDSFWSSFLEKIRTIYTLFFVCPAFSTCIYHHHRASYFTHGFDDQAYAAIQKNVNDAVFGPANFGSYSCQKS